jgi:biotin synthase
MLDFAKNLKQFSPGWGDAGRILIENTETFCRPCSEMGIDFVVIQKKSLGGETLTRQECHAVLDCPSDLLEELSRCVYEVRRKYKGNKVSVQILTNAKSGNCSQNCAYCAQSAISRANIEKYPLIPFEILAEHSSIGEKNGIGRHCIGLSGMRFSDGQIDDFCAHIQRLGVKTPICCSIGFLTREQAQKIKDVGITRINHNLNTSRNFYPNICTTHTYDERRTNIKMLQSLGFEICTGGIVGMGETDDDVIDMLFDVREIGPESVPINFLVPIPGTPLAGVNMEKLTAEYCVKVLMLTRFLNPKADVRCAAGREIYIKNMHIPMFRAVNSIFAAGYLTTAGEGIANTIQLIRDCGFEYETA